MINQETWEVANKYANNLLLTISFVINILQAILFVLLGPEDYILYVVVILTTGVLTIPIFTERFLKD